MTKVARKEYSKLRKNIFFGGFSRLDPFPQVFRQVKECLIPQLHKMIRVLHLVTCLIVFVWFYNGD